VDGACAWRRFEPRGSEPRGAYLRPDMSGTGRLLSPAGGSGRVGVDRAGSGSGGGVGEEAAGFADDGDAVPGGAVQHGRGGVAVGYDQTDGRSAGLA